MATVCNSGWSKIDKYYTKTSESPAYAAAVVLHPANKWQEIENNWSSEWIPPAKAMVKKLWETEYKPKTTTLPKLTSKSTSTSTSTSNSTKNTYKEWHDQKKRAQAPMDKYDRFI